MSDSSRRVLNIIIAIVVSIGAWTYVVYNNDPMTEVKYKDIPITFIGEDYLANNGLGVSTVSAESIDVTLKQRRVDTNDITAADITVLADLSSAAEGENGISLQISGPENTQVSEAEKRSIAVEVEESDTKEMTIFIEYEDAPEGYEPVTSRLTSTEATVIGAKSEIALVDKIAARINFDDTNVRARNYTTKLSACDRSGDVIEHVVIYPGELNFNAYLGVTKEVPLTVVTEDPEEEKTASTDETSDQTEEEQDDGYVRTYTAPKTIMVKGSEGNMSKVEEIKSVYIDIDNIYEDVEMPLELDMPEGIYFANGQEEPVIRIKVERKETEADEEQ